MVQNQTSTSEFVTRESSRIPRGLFRLHGSTNGHTTSEELQQQGYSRQEADRVAARRNADENIIRTCLRFYLIWVALFVLMSIPTFVCFFLLLYSYAEYRWLPCDSVLQMWTEVVFFLIIYSVLLHKVIEQKLCGHYPSEDPTIPRPVPFRIKALMAFRLFASTGWCVVGIFFALQDTECKAELDRIDYERFGAAIIHFAVCYLFLNIHFCVLFTGPLVLLRYAQRQGWLYGPEAAPKGTASRLATVLESGDPEFELIRNDGCSICLDPFHPDAKVIKKTHCGHYFHLDCLDSWLQVSRDCPLCRFDVADAVDPTGKHGLPEAV